LGLTPFSECHYTLLRESFWMTLSDLANYPRTQSIAGSLCDSWASCYSVLFFFPPHYLTVSQRVIVLVSGVLSENYCVLSQLQLRLVLSVVTCSCQLCLVAHCLLLLQRLCTSACTADLLMVCCLFYVFISWWTVDAAIEINRYVQCWCMLNRSEQRMYSIQLRVAFCTDTETAVCISVCNRWHYEQLFEILCVW